MSTAQALAQFTQYPQEPPRVGRGVLIAIGIHLFVATTICLVLYLLGIQSLKELLDKGGAIAASGPAPEQTMVVQIKLDDIKPPPTDHIEFIQQVLKQKVVPVTPKPPVPNKPIVKVQPKFTAPKATGAGVTNAVSKFILGSSGLPHPSYPTPALDARQEGTVQMRVTFDGSGGIASADVVSSSGVTLLDSWTRNFIYGHWKNAGLANQTVTVPVVYDLSDTRSSH